MQHAPAPLERVARLREVAQPYLHALVEELGETVNLMVLAGADVRFVATVESDQVLRVGDRTGRVLPADRSSGGKALLAARPPADVTALVGEETSSRLARELRTVRRRGFAVNDQETEAGLTAVGVAVPDPEGPPSAALSVSMPTVRYSRQQLPVLGAALVRAAARVAQEL